MRFGQAAWRRWQLKSAILAKVKLNSTLRIQAFWRGFAARKRFQRAWSRLRYIDDDEFDYIAVDENDYAADPSIFEDNFLPLNQLMEDEKLCEPLNRVPEAKVVQRAKTPCLTSDCDQAGEFRQSDQTRNNFTTNSYKPFPGDLGMAKEGKKTEVQTVKRNRYRLIHEAAKQLPVRNSDSNVGKQEDENATAPANFRADKSSASQPAIEVRHLRNVHVFLKQHSTHKNCYQVLSWEVQLCHSRFPVECLLRTKGMLEMTHLTPLCDLSHSNQQVH